MHHESKIDVIERTVLGQDDLAADGLLSRSPDDYDVAAHLVHDRRQRDAGTHGRRCNDIVAAAMPDAAQSIVFSKERDMRPGRPAMERRTVRSVETTIRRLDFKTVMSQHLRLPLNSVVLLHPQLGVVMDSVTQLQQFSPGIVSRPQNCFLHHALPPPDANCGRVDGITAVSYTHLT